MGIGKYCFCFQVYILILQNYSKNRALPKKELHKGFPAKILKEKKIREDFIILANLSKILCKTTTAKP